MPVDMFEAAFGGSFAVDRAAAGGVAGPGASAGLAPATIGGDRSDFRPRDVFAQTAGAIGGVDPETEAEVEKFVSGGRAFGERLFGPETKSLEQFLGKEHPISRAIDKVGKAIPGIAISSVLGGIPGLIAGRGMGKLIEAGRRETDEGDIRTASLPTQDGVRDGITDIARRTPDIEPLATDTVAPEVAIEGREAQLPEAPAAPSIQETIDTVAPPNVPDLVKQRILQARRFAPTQRRTPRTAGARQSFAITGRA